MCVLSGYYCNIIGSRVIHILTSTNDRKQGALVILNYNARESYMYYVGTLRVVVYRVLISNKLISMCSLLVQYFIIIYNV